MKMKQVLRSIYITIIVVGMVIGFSSMQCDPIVPTKIDFAIRNDMNDSVFVKIKYVDNGKSDVYKTWNLAWSSPVRVDDYAEIYHKKYSREDKISDISWDEAMMMLKENIETVIMTRMSDAKTVLYRYGDNATEKEKYFFSQEAWYDSPEYANHVEDKLIHNTYRFIITEELFE